MGSEMCIRDRVFDHRDSRGATSRRVDGSSHLAMDFVGHGDEFPNNGTAHEASSKIIAAAFSPIMIAGALVFPVVRVGMIDASATRNPESP